MKVNFNLMQNVADNICNHFKIDTIKILPKKRQTGCQGYFFYKNGIDYYIKLQKEFKTAFDIYHALLHELAHWLNYSRFLNNTPHYRITKSTTHYCHITPTDKGHGRLFKNCEYEIREYYLTTGGTT